MKTLSIPVALALGASVAHAQYQGLAQTDVPLVTTTTQPTQAVAPNGGSFSGGGADCSMAVSVGTGPTAVNFPFDNTMAASMGVATNPFEALCNFGGGTGINNEEWFSWTATSAGLARLSACSGLIGVDTKIAIYADDCANITTLDPLACKDNSGGCVETVLTWDITPGTSYLIQLGTPPAGAGGAGDFSIEELAPLPDGQYDLGQSFNALGFGAAAGDIMFAHAYDAGAGATLNSVEVAWGLNGGTQMPAGGPATLVVYQGNPATGVTFQYSQAIATANENTDTFVTYPLTTPQPVVGIYSVAIYYQVTAPPVFPAAWDDTVQPAGRSWIALETLNIPLDINDPTTAEQPPINLFDVVWLIRANATPGLGGFPEACFGDGGDGMGCTPCPCGNEAPMGSMGGCLNSNGASGRLVGSGSPSVSAADPADLRFDAEGLVAASFCVLTSGNAVAPANAANPCFGLDSGLQSNVLDGLRCAVQQTQRHGGRPVDASGQVGATTNGWGGASGPPNGLADQGGFIAGQTRHYQGFYRELPGQVCLTEQNTTQAVTVTFEP